MTTLDHLKQSLRDHVKGTTLLRQIPLSDEQYSAGFDTVVQGSKMSYEEFIIPQLIQIMGPLVDSRRSLSILEIGPGPNSILTHLPYRLRWSIKTYTAFEPNSLFATRLEESLRPTFKKGHPLPLLEQPPTIHQVAFDPAGGFNHGNIPTDGSEETYDIILFCHSMYGMKSKSSFIKHALSMVKEKPEKGMVVVFHRSGSLHFDELVSHRTSLFSTGLLRVRDNDSVLDCFAQFIAGFAVEAAGADSATRMEWRRLCRALAHRTEAYPDHLLFSAPEITVVFTRHAASLPELRMQVPLADSGTVVKNWVARSHQPASIVKPSDVRQVQKCVQWALKHGTGLTVIGGGHSGHCLWPNVVAVDMAAFNQIHVVAREKDCGIEVESGSFVIVEAGCKTGDIIRKTMAAGVTVPLGARPSVGGGLWLQGGIGHLARRYGLTCDTIVGAVMVSVQSGQIFVIGYVPHQHRPADAVFPECGSDMLWALKGAGTNFGIVISVTLKTYCACTYLVRNWISPMQDGGELRTRMSVFDNEIAKKLQRDCSVDGYLYHDARRLQFGMTMIESSTAKLASATPPQVPVDPIWGAEDSFQVVDGVGLFETELYMSKLHGGHGGGKTSSFKRCIFLTDIGEAKISNLLAAVLETCPTTLCYLHLLHGGGAVGDAAPDATAFGCRNWDFACVVTGVWLSGQDHDQTAETVVQWVYDTVSTLLPMSCGVYGADLGTDPRDAALAAKAFGPNLARLAYLKCRMDPSNLLAHTCPLRTAPREQRLIILVTGESGAGKDFCADVWNSIIRSSHESLTTRAVSISDVTKQEYAAATGADLKLLLGDRTYKEQHRPKLTTFFQKQMQQRPRLPEEHFSDVVHSEADADVLLITGMRDEAPVANLSHLVPDRRVLEVQILASEHTRQARRCNQSSSTRNGHANGPEGSNATTLDHRPSFIFSNDNPGEEAAKSFAQLHLLPFLHEDLQQLADMVRCKPNFPHEGTNFRHVLGISQQPGGLTLCTSLLRTHFAGEWENIDAIVCCEAGGFIYAPPLASLVNIPLVPIRKAGKLPPPTVSVSKTRSYISSLTTEVHKEKRIEIERDAIPSGAMVVVVDDVLSTGETLCAVLQLLSTVGVPASNVSILVVAELPIHRGRQLLRHHGFGKVDIRSLLVFDGT